MNEFQEFVDRHSEIANYIPFVSLMITEEKSPMVTKLLETGIMAALAFGASLYVAVPIIQKDIDVLQRDIQKIDAKVDKVEDKVERIKADIYKPYIDQRLTSK